MARVTRWSRRPGFTLIELVVVQQDSDPNVREAALAGLKKMNRTSQ